MKDFKVFYDENEDILYFAQEGEEEETIELHPGINMELDKEGKIIGLEIFEASLVFKEVIKPMEMKLEKSA